MLEYLILNNRLEAAASFNTSSTRTYREELLDAYSKGHRTDFLKIFTLLHRQPKLEFYLRVYFLIYWIHPTLKNSLKIPEQEISAFRSYLDAEGAQLAKSNEFLQFYALPFVKKPLEHASFRPLFRKEWVNSLTQKLSVYLQEEHKRIRQIANKFISSKAVQSGEGRVKEMEQKNAKLFMQIEQLKQKYSTLESNHRDMVQFFNKCAAQSQGKWMQITRQLTVESKTLIEMISRTDSSLLNHRKFLRIKKKIMQYDKIVQKQVEELMNQSQDISLFEKHSVNEVSYSVSNAPQLIDHNITGLAIEEYLPTNYALLAKDFKRMSPEQKVIIIQGFVWRIMNSKNVPIRRQNIVGLFLTDIFGFLTGQINQLLQDKPLRHPTLKLFQRLALDSYGMKVLFRSAGYYKELKKLLPSIIKDKQYESARVILNIFEILSPQHDLTIELISMGTVRLLLDLLQIQAIFSDEIMLEHVLSVLLNLSTVNEGLEIYEKEEDIFSVLMSAFKSENNDIQLIILAMIYSLIRKKTLFTMAHLAGVPSFIEDVMEHYKLQNKQQCLMILERLKVFKAEAGRPEEKDEDSLNSEQYAQIFDSKDDSIGNSEDHLKGHEILMEKYCLQGTEATKQLVAVNNLIAKQQKPEPLVQAANSTINPPDAISFKLPEIKGKPKRETDANRQHLQLLPPVVEDPNIYKSPSFKHLDKPKQVDISLHSHERKLYELDNPTKYISVSDKPRANSGRARNPDRSLVTQPKAEDRVQPIRKSSAERPEYRIKMSSSFEKKSAKPARMANKQESLIQQPKPVQTVLAVKSPPRKKSREQLLRMVNEELKAEVIERRPSSKISANASVARKEEGRKEEGRKEEGRKEEGRKEESKKMYGSFRENAINRNNYATEDEIVAFVAKPKLRRTPPKEE